MDRASIANAVRQFVHDNYLLGREYHFTDDDSFLDQSIIDSIGILQLVMFLQDTYGVTVEDDERIPQNLDSITAASDYICRKLNGVQQRHSAPTGPTLPGASV